MPSSIHPVPKLALFDLDHTLLEGDCGQLWLQFLTAQGRISEADWRPRLGAFYQDYLNGCLDIAAYTSFQLSFQLELGADASEALRRSYFQGWVKPRIRPQGENRIREYRQAGVAVVIVTATHRYFAEPVAAALGVDDLIATETDAAMDGRHVLRGSAAFAEGKRDRASEWCAARTLTLQDCHFYSDSHNDLPLLSAAGRAFVVTPDATLAEHARNHAWPCLDWRLTQNCDGALS